jgi:hypothetical protein
MSQSTTARLPPPKKRLRGKIPRGVCTHVFPTFSARVRRLFYNPLGMLIVAALAALLCGAFLHPQGFVFFGSLTAVIGLGVAWPWLSLQGLRGAISFERCKSDPWSVDRTRPEHRLLHADARHPYGYPPMVAKGCSSTVTRASSMIVFRGAPRPRSSGTACSYAEASKSRSNRDCSKCRPTEKS